MLVLGPSGVTQIIGEPFSPVSDLPDGVVKLLSRKTIGSLYLTTRGFN